jgi:hypothetical protein
LTGNTVRPFHESIHVAASANAEFFAADLFYESFAQPFPVPRDNCGLSIPTPPENWRQYVTFYKWPNGAIEVVGFCNWIRYREVYLEGGLCVRRNFYRELPKQHWDACKEAGGIAQIMIEGAARELTDCVAWFGYCGDKKSFIVNSRVGYERTNHKYLIVKWFADIDEDARQRLIDSIGSIGPF